VAEGDEVCVFGKPINHRQETDLPCTFGRLSTKSMEMSAHTCEGTSRGCSSPAGCVAGVLLRWHVS
jgi:hypothetical protein